MDRNGASYRGRRPGDGFVLVVTLLAGIITLSAGLWALLAPRSFAEAVRFPYGRHFVHDTGAFQIGIGATLLLALAWRDGLALALAGFLVGKPRTSSATSPTWGWAAAAGSRGGWRRSRSWSRSRSSCGCARSATWSAR